MNHFVFFVCMELDIQGREKYRSCLCKHKLRNNSSMLSFSKIRVFEEPTGCQGFTLVVNPYENYFNKFSLNIFPDVSRKSVNVKKNNGNFKLFFFGKNAFSKGRIVLNFCGYWSKIENWKFSASLFLHIWELSGYAQITETML